MAPLVGAPPPFPMKSHLSISGDFLKDRTNPPGTLNSNNKPDRPANLPGPYKRAATAGVSEMEEPQKKPYRTANAICGTVNVSTGRLAHG